MDNPKIRIPLTVSERRQPVPMAVGQRQQQIPLQVSGGGSGGTRDYNKLSNRPTLNGVLIEGDHDSAHYGIDLNAKLDIYQGTEYAGQPMVVGSDGYVTPMPSGGLLVEDGDGNVWRFLAGEGRAGDIVIEDEAGNLWHAPTGEGRAGDIPLEDDEGGVWFLPAGAGDSGGGGLPPGGTDGQYLVKDSSAPGGARWADLPTYSPTAETWTVTPLVGAETTLATAGKYLDRNIQVEAIPYAEVTNISGGKTATIGG